MRYRAHGFFLLLIRALGPSEQGNSKTCSCVKDPQGSSTQVQSTSPTSHICSAAAHNHLHPTSVGPQKYMHIHVIYNWNKCLYIHTYIHDIICLGTWGPYGIVERIGLMPSTPRGSSLGSDSESEGERGQPAVSRTLRTDKN